MADGETSAARAAPAGAGNCFWSAGGGAETGVSACIEDIPRDGLGVLLHDMLMASKMRQQPRQWVASVAVSRVCARLVDWVRSPVPESLLLPSSSLTSPSPAAAAGVGGGPSASVVDVDADFSSDSGLSHLLRTPLSRAAYRALMTLDTYTAAGCAAPPLNDLNSIYGTWLGLLHSALGRYSARAASVAGSSTSLRPVSVARGWALLRLFLGGALVAPDSPLPCEGAAGETVTEKTALPGVSHAVARGDALARPFGAQAVRSAFGSVPWNAATHWLSSLLVSSLTLRHSRLFAM